MPATEEGDGPNSGKRRSMRRRKDKGKRDGSVRCARGGRATEAGARERRKKCGEVIRTISQKNFKKHIKTLEKTGKLC
mgnify:CR=1 FL=1